MGLQLSNLVAFRYLATEIRDAPKLIRRDKPLKIKGMPRAEARARRLVQPRLLAEVDFTEITTDGDKDAREVQLEVA